LYNRGKGSTKEKLFILKSKAMEKLTDLKAKQLIEKQPVLLDRFTILSETREVSRQNAGILDILGSLFDELGFSKNLSGKARKVLDLILLKWYWH
jgi:hypothetical protein